MRVEICRSYEEIGEFDTQGQEGEEKLWVPKLVSFCIWMIEQGLGGISEKTNFNKSLRKLWRAMIAHIAHRKI